MTSTELRLDLACTGSGARILLLHPIGLDRRFWTRLATQLEGEMTLCALDLPGHGDSPMPAGPISIEDMADCVAATMRAQELGPAIVAGCSLGGMVAQALAARAPDLVRGLILANTNYTQTAQGRAAMQARAEAARATGMAQVAQTCMARWFAPDVAAADPEGMAQIRAMLLAGDGDVHARCWDAIGNLDLADALARITVPALVVAGGNDMSIPLEKAEMMTALLRRATLRTIAGAGHLTPFERPEAFAGLVREFARDLPDDQTGTD